MMTEIWSTFKLQVFVTIIHIKDSSQTSLREKKILPVPSIGSAPVSPLILVLQQYQVPGKGPGVHSAGAVQRDSDFTEIIANIRIPPCPTKHENQLQW